MAWSSAGSRRASAQESPSEVGRIREMILSTEPVGYAGCCAAIRDMDERDRLGLIEAPALVLIGEHDPATTPENGQYHRRAHSRRAESGGRFAHISPTSSSPEDFNRVVLGFLAGKQA